MTKEEYDNKIKEIKENGYRYENGITRPYYYKVIEYRDYKGKKRAVNQLMFNIYDLSKYADKIPSNSFFSIEPMVEISRSVDELIYLKLSYLDKERSLEELEKIAVEFGQWVDTNIKKYEKE